MQLSVEVYLDKMVKFDKLLMPSLGKKNNKKLPNFMKSNSLGLLCVTEAHHNFGPARLHWEGGVMGERKIQEAKPMIKICPGNCVDWTNLCLNKIQRNACLDMLLQQCGERKKETKREMRLYQNVEELKENLNSSMPPSFIKWRDRFCAVVKEI